MLSRNRAPSSATPRAESWCGAALTQQQRSCSKTKLTPIGEKLEMTQVDEIAYQAK